MNVQGKTIWQHAAGDTNRNYVDLCLEWNVILNGPGNPGRWPHPNYEGMRKYHPKKSRIYGSSAKR